MGKRIGAALLCLALTLALGGCDFLPSADFDDYDVSGYIQALLDSSYRDSHQLFMDVTQATQEGAKQNNTTTVGNAAINFCNAYNLSPSEEQMTRLEGIMSQALRSVRYTVKEEQKVDTGYYIEVEVTPMVNLAGLGDEFKALRTQAQEEADAANTPAATPEPDEGDGDGDWGNEGWEDGGEEGEPSPTPAPTPEAPKVDAYSLYIDKVLDSCQGKIAEPQFQTQSIVVALNIVQTNEGDLQLDLNQIDTIDQTVLLFK